MNTIKNILTTYGMDILTVTAILGILLGTLYLVTIVAGINLFVILAFIVPVVAIGFTIAEEIF